MIDRTLAFTAETRREGDAVVIDLQGEINSLADAALDTAYTAAEQENLPRIVLNFAGVDYINSTGIALIVGLLARARAAHRPIAATGLSEHYREIFTITRLSDFMEIQ